MNKIPLPPYDDAGAFLTLSNNHLLASYPQLQAVVGTVQSSYAHYVAARGAPLLVLQPVGDNVAKFLKGHYSSPPTDLAHITEMRESSEHLVCPMCGSMHSGTLDHYLPKNGFPTFAIFSKNLVPACKCNSKRKETLTGASPNERVLHPYFDECLGERLVRAQFDDLGDVPRVSLSLMIPNTHPHHSAISFHVRSIVQRSALRKYLADRWSSLFRKPSLVVRALGKNVATAAELDEILENERDALDDLHRGKNNWNSIFVSGLLQPPVVIWLTARLSVPGREPDSPLG
ncbi:hypothetical protein QTI33_12015 [Variovorax sp. J22P271]|uniref:hypothetical protein n=1 Tax=Variovorax davisae TaxID=3053515 RepID=UPI00257756CD|nr:hypothetical protein [Variovorax sp. J22P271]MDM0032849.1 hypothetical protein [Variovorax sp. J22P271]